ncbi:MAG TPA: rhamnulokinase family protein [Abditibacteriaceae bacterium]|jgi:sugar (pentulose or hexulose) kinase
MESQTYAAIDIGAESGRVIAGRFDGSTLQLEEIHRFGNIPSRANGTLYWDALRLWNDIQDGLTKLDGPIAGIGADTWGVDFGLLDERDELLGNPVHYRDARTANYESAYATVPQSEIAEITGLAFMPFNTLYQLNALKSQNAVSLRNAKTLLFMPDLMHFWLSGEKANEYSIASTSQMLDARTRTWSEELFARFDLPRDIFPRMVQPGTKLGALRGDVAARAGLASDTPVIAPGSHDTASAVVAAPGEGENWAYLSSGTWSLMGLELPEPRINADTARWNFTNEGGAGGRIRFLKNIAGLWLVQQCRAAFTHSGNEFTYAELTHLAREATPLRSLIEPDDARFAAPDSMPEQIMAFCRETGQHVPETPGQLVRCCLESLALKYRWTLEKLEFLRGARIDTLHIVGGGTQNTLLNQFAADCLDRRVVCGPIEATAAGNILTQAMGRGELGSLEEVRAIVRASFEMQTYEPNAANRAAWDEAYGRFSQF